LLWNDLGKNPNLFRCPTYLQRKLTESPGGAPFTDFWGYSDTKPVQKVPIYSYEVNGQVGMSCQPGAWHNDPNYDNDFDVKVSSLKWPPSGTVQAIEVEQTDSGGFDNGLQLFADAPNMTFIPESGVKSTGFRGKCPKTLGLVRFLCSSRRISKVSLSALDRLELVDVM